MAIPVGFCGLASILAFGQAGDERTRFEVASIRPADHGGSSRGGPNQRFGCSGGPGSSDAGRITCRATSFTRLIIDAYRIRTYQFSPLDWMNQASYDVVATIPAGSTGEQVQLMKQNLLAERFKMVSHFDKKEMSAFELKIGRDGPKCNETVADPPPPDGIVMGDYQQAGGRVIHKTKQTMTQLAFYLTVRLGRPVFDVTGLTGTYDINLDFVQEPSAQGGRPRGVLANAGAPPSAAEPDDGPSLIKAVQSQLGLQLEPKKRIVDVLVVDHAEKTPVEN
jgi:uncharacterized protein (TIGR03435 family)